MKSSRSFLIYWVFSLLPSSRCFGFKRFLLRWAGAVVGKDVRVVSSARFFLSGRLILGDAAWVGHEVLIVGGDADVYIGENVDIGPRVTLVTGSHELFSTTDKAAGKGYSLPISIGHGSWIGANATLLGGTAIGECTLVAAGALVKGEISDHSIVGGVPARHLKSDN